MLFGDQDSDEDIELICNDNIFNSKDDFNLESIDESQSIDVDVSKELNPTKKQSYDDFRLNFHHNKTASSSKVI